MDSINNKFINVLLFLDGNNILKLLWRNKKMAIERRTKMDRDTSPGVKKDGDLLSRINSMTDVWDQKASAAGSEFDKKFQNYQNQKKQGLENLDVNKVGETLSELTEQGQQIGVLIGELNFELQGHFRKI